MTGESSEPIYYPDGDNCIFNAIQRASSFYGAPRLTVEDKDRLQNVRERSPKLYTAITGKEKEAYGWLKITLQILFRELKKNDILPTKFTGNLYVKEAIENINFIKNTNAPFGIVGGDGEAEFELPALFLISTNGATNHVWFVATDEEFDKDFPVHVPTGHEIILIVEFKKK